MFVKIKTLVASLSLALVSSSSLADTLSDVYQLALKNDALMQAAEANYNAGKENKNIFRAALLPQVNARYSRVESDIDRSTYSTQQDAIIAGNTDTTSKTSSASLGQALFNLPAWYGYQQGKELTNAAEANYLYEKQNLIIRVASAYFDVLRAKENLTSAKAEEKAISRQLEQTQQRFEVGLIPITDVHEARAGYDLAVVARLAAEGSLSIAEEALTVVTGQSHANLWVLKDSFEAAVPSPQEPQQWVDWALANNALLKASSFNVQAAKSNADAKRAAHLPKVSAEFGWTDSENDGTSFNSMVADATDGTTISLNVTVPIFAGGGTSAARRQAYQQYLAALEGNKQAQRNTIQFTRSQYISVLTGAAAVKARSQAITSAQSALDATQAGYDVGTRNIVDVLNAQKNLYRTKRDYANARYEFVVNVLKLRQQAGLLDGGDIDTLQQSMTAPAAATASGQ
jgi:outer membrane protein